MALRRLNSIQKKSTVLLRHKAHHGKQMEIPRAKKNRTRAPEHGPCLFNPVRKRDPVKIAENIENAIDILLSDFVTSKSSALCAALQPIALTGITIYLILRGISLSRGYGNETFSGVLEKILRISVITELALQVGVYQEVIVGGLTSIGIAVMEITTGETSFGAVLDKLAEPYAILGDKLWSDATVGVLPHVGLLFAAAVVSLSQAVLFSVGLGLYLLAKVSVTLTFAVGPAFILCAIWPSTQKYTESWLGQTLNYIFLKVLVGITFVMLTSFASQYARHITAKADALNVIDAACALLLVSIVLTIIMLFHPQLSTALFGGASVSGVGRAIFRLLERLLQAPSSNPPKDPKPHANSILDRPKTSNSIEHARYTPLYQRHTLERLRTGK
ncbi:TrbL/VirB6 plasmid conjugal transfer protein [Duganella sp. HH105]|nr:TrbL/VirB6 plasmid conjugal transfer protein [Duganella sp. HH105]